MSLTPEQQDITDRLLKDGYEPDSYVGFCPKCSGIVASSMVRMDDKESLAQSIYDWIRRGLNVHRVPHYTLQSKEWCNCPRRYRDMPEGQNELYRVELHFQVMVTVPVTGDPFEDSTAIDCAESEVRPSDGSKPYWAEATPVRNLDDIPKDCRNSLPYFEGQQVLRLNPDTCNDVAATCEEIVAMNSRYFLPEGQYERQELEALGQLELLEV